MLTSTSMPTIGWSSGISICNYSFIKLDQELLYKVRRAAFVHSGAARCLFLHFFKRNAGFLAEK